MTPEALSRFLQRLVEHRLMFSTMIWGPPGIGKSSIVVQTAQAHDLDVIDLRLSQDGLAVPGSSGRSEGMNQRPTHGRDRGDASCEDSLFDHGVLPVTFPTAVLSRR